MNTQLAVKDSARNLSPFFDRGIFGGSLLDSLFADPFRLMDQSLRLASPVEEKARRLEDGSVELSYNLAGYDEKDISVRFDTVNGELIIVAEANDEHNLKRMSFTRSLNPYLSAEDISTELRNGILKVTVAPFEKRKEEALVSIPFNSKKELKQGEDT